MSLPVCLFISPILNMWLGGNVPEYTSSFVIIMLITNTWGSLVAPISAIVLATGKMKFYQTISSASNLMSVPLAYVFLCIDSVPEFVFLCSFDNNVYQSYSRANFVKATYFLFNKKVYTECGLSVSLCHYVVCNNDYYTILLYFKCSFEFHSCYCS